MDYLISNYQWILGIAAVMAAYITFVLLPQLKENDVKNVYQHAGKPILMLQVSELEKDYWARVTREQRRYIDSGNRWAVIQTPVVYFPYNSAFEFEWFSVKYHRSTIGLSYDEYLVAGLAFYREMKAIWEQKAYGQFGMDTLMQAKNQQAINPEKIWQYAN